MPACLDPRRNQQGINQRSEFWIKRILAKELTSIARAGAAVEVLVHDSDEAFVEERVALARDLDPFTGDVLLFASATFSQDGDLLTAGRGIDTDDLLVAAGPVPRSGCSVPSGEG